MAPNIDIDAKEEKDDNDNGANISAKPVLQLSMDGASWRCCRILVPTKTADGGSSRSDATSGNSRKDAFLLYSDNNVRIKKILGLCDDADADADDDGAARNDDDDDDWRQIIGYQGLGRRSRLHHDHHNENDDVHRNDRNQGGKDDANEKSQEQSSPRRNTRISYELHDIAFRAMYLHSDDEE